MLGEVSRPRNEIDGKSLRPILVCGHSHGFCAKDRHADRVADALFTLTANENNGFLFTKREKIREFYWDRRILCVGRAQGIPGFPRIVTIID